MKKTILILLCVLNTGTFADFTRVNGVVTDSRTSLQWQDDYSDNAGDIKRANWEDAITYCEALSLDGTMWRLANIRELRSLINYTKIYPANDAIFQNTASSAYWSSTTSAGHSSTAWYVGFRDGTQNFGNKTVSTYVRCVRDGQ